LTKRIAVFLLILFAPAMGACNSFFNTGKNRAANFSLVFFNSPCGTDKLDTANNILVYTPLGKTESLAIPFQLTDNELNTIYKKTVEIDFFSYPSDFVIPAQYMVPARLPASTYYLTINNGTMSKKVMWINGGPTAGVYPEADHLWELITMIQEIIRSHPEYQQIPKTSPVCE
jgi:hypothetical protein